MASAEPHHPAEPRTGRTHGRRTTWAGAIGETLLTLGAIALLFAVWQLWIGDWIGAAQKDAAGRELSQRWAAESPGSSPSSFAPSASPSARSAPTSPPVVLPAAADGETFAIMHIPRFGSDYQVPIAGGTTRARTLDPIGIGHYLNTPMPGAVGNVALAAHRTTYGKPFNRIADLHIGDAIVIETQGGWYTYRFRTLEYVKPTALDVLLPVPQDPGAVAEDRYLTMTSCSPMYSKAERIVAFSDLDSFTPRAEGPPSSLTEGAE